MEPKNPDAPEQGTPLNSDVSSQCQGFLNTGFTSLMASVADSKAEDTAPTHQLSKTHFQSEQNSSIQTLGCDVPTQMFNTDLNPLLANKYPVNFPNLISCSVNVGSFSPVSDVSLHTQPASSSETTQHSEPLTNSDQTFPVCRNDVSALLTPSVCSAGTDVQKPKPLIVNVPKLSDNQDSQDGLPLKTVDTIPQDKNQQTTSSESRTQSEKACCRICQEDDTYEELVSPCYCTGTVGFMHITCLEKWLCTNGRTQCELCSFPFPVEKILPSIWEYFRHPTQNMDCSSLMCDLSCFVLLTPLLVASTYLCSIGVRHYKEIGKVESVFAIITLMVSLISVYIAWSLLAFMYHHRVWLSWREKSAHILMWNHQSSLTYLRKNVDNVGDDSDTSALGSQTTSSTTPNGPLILRPWLRYKRILQSKTQNPRDNRIMFTNII